ncbi:MAG: lactoylglutathione lyase [Flavobacteriales bacterium 32-35-8]|nr:MAG: lactoylglutathione lyase [Flavobacteriales bacterium 32-35-8]
MHNPVVWFEIYTDNLQRAKIFYENVFQIQLSVLPTPEDMPLQMLAFPSNMESKNRTSGALVYMEGFKAGGNSTIVYFYSKDCAIEEARIEAFGGSVFRSKMSIGDYGFIVLALDTEGNMIGIHSME